MPQGRFTVAPSHERRPLVLLAAGVGITPLLSMLREVVYQGLRTCRSASPEPPACGDEQAHHPNRIAGIPEQAIQSPTKRLIGQGARTLEKPRRADTAGAQALVHHLAQHRQQRRDTNPRRQQHQWPTFQGRHREMPLRRPSLQHIADPDLLMQVG